MTNWLLTDNLNHEFEIDTKHDPVTVWSNIDFALVAILKGEKVEVRDLGHFEACTLLN